MFEGGLLTRREYVVQEEINLTIGNKIKEKVDRLLSERNPLYTYSKKEEDFVVKEQVFLSNDVFAECKYEDIGFHKGLLEYKLYGNIVENGKEKRICLGFSDPDWRSDRWIYLEYVNENNIININKISQDKLDLIAEALGL
jgi:hypothetical protein